MSLDHKEYLKDMCDATVRDKDPLQKLLNWQNPVILQMYKSWETGQTSLSASDSWNRKQFVLSLISGTNPRFDQFISSAINQTDFAAWLEYKKNNNLNAKSPYKIRIEYFWKEQPSGTPTLSIPSSTNLEKKKPLKILKEETKSVSSTKDISDFNADIALLKKDVETYLKSEDKTPRLKSNIQSSFKRLELSLNELIDDN